VNFTILHTFWSLMQSFNQAGHVKRVTVLSLPIRYSKRQCLSSFPVLQTALQRQTKISLTSVTSHNTHIHNHSQTHTHTHWWWWWL
jgi:hypothetical protein